MTNTPPRPIFIDDDDKLAVGEIMAEELIAVNMVSEDKRDEVAREISQVVDIHQNGYDLARALDDKKGWLIDANIVQVLDRAPYARAYVIDEKQKAWVEKHKIKPDCRPGQRVNFDWMGKTVSGTILSIAESRPATYVIHVDDEHGLDFDPLIFFENVTLEPEVTEDE